MLLYIRTQHVVGAQSKAVSQALPRVFPMPGAAKEGRGHQGEREVLRLGAWLSQLGIRMNLAWTQADLVRDEGSAEERMGQQGECEVLPTLDPEPQPLHPAFCILHPPPSTLHPPPSTLHPPPSTLHLPPSTLFNRLPGWS